MTKYLLTVVYILACISFQCLWWTNSC